MTDKEALKLALEALEELYDTNSSWWQEVDEQTLKKIENSIPFIKEALAQPDAFEQGRQEGMKQERALWQLSRLGQEIEAQPEQEPVAKFHVEHRTNACSDICDAKGKVYATCAWHIGARQRAEHICNLLNTTPPKRTWAGLTGQEKQEWIDAMPYDIEPRHCMILVNVIEAKLKEKNT